ncbi:transposase family protein [Candidatus Poribacteria bacterium]|nr:transposase family protein [Candidatus Poribacteria bacterium]
MEAISQQYGVPPSTFYSWLSRYETHQTYENLSKAPHQTLRKVTLSVKDAVLKKHRENPRLGCWRLSLFEYEGQKLSHTTIWLILMEAEQPKLPPQVLYHLTHAHQIWFIDHMYLRTLPDGQKIYSLIVLDGWSRVLLSEEICWSKGARDACLILIRAFARWGMPEEILSDNAKAFWSLLYRLLLGRLRIKVSYTTPGCPWENPFAESFIGTLRAYFYPHLQRQKSVAGVERIYQEKTDDYNHRVHWAFRKDDVKTPLGKLGAEKGRPLPEHFELSLLATGKRFPRTVNGVGFLSFKRYRLYVDTDLKRQQVEIREFFDTLVITYQRGTIVSYACSHERSEVIAVENTPVFHDYPGIFHSPQMELFNLSSFKWRYVYRRPPNRKHPKPKKDATQLEIDFGKESGSLGG